MNTITLPIGWDTLQLWMLPAAIILISLLTGILLNRLVSQRLRAIPLSESMEQAHELLVHAFRGIPILWSLMGGIYLTTRTVSLSANIQQFLASALLALVLLSATLVAARIVGGLATLYAKRAQTILPTTSILVTIAEVFVFLLGALITLESLGISITPILTALGVGGLAVALALQDTLANLFAGLSILFSRQLRPGDYICLSTKEEGHISDINWRSTTIRTLSQQTVIIPNVKVAQSIITNYSFPSPQLSVVIPASVAYDSNLEQVEAITLEEVNAVLRETMDSPPQEEPLIRFHTFGDSGIAFNIIFTVHEYSELSPLRHALIKRLIKRYRQEGIVIPYPTQEVYLKNH